MKKEYPYYMVTANIWIPPDEKFHEGEYEYKTIFQSKDKDEAEKIWKETEMNADFLHIELFEEWEDDTIRLAYKDLMDDGTVEEVYGE